MIFAFNIYFKFVIIMCIFERGVIFKADRCELLFGYECDDFMRTEDLSLPAPVHVHI